MQNLHNNPTLSYYSENAEKFVTDTANMDMGDLYQEFLPLIPENGIILDAGAGSGRDTKYFLEKGYKVVAFDNSPEMVKIASDYTDQDVLLMSFSDVAFNEEFDAIWACSSLLHVSSSNLPNVLFRLAESLRTNGILYASFKYGDNEAIRNGRFFRDYTENSFNGLLARCPIFKLIKYWRTYDFRPDRQNEKWLNVIIQKI